MNERQINRAVGIWVAFPNDATGTLSGVLSFSSETNGVRFHSYGELMALLRRLAAVRTVEHAVPVARLKLAS